MIDPISFKLFLGAALVLVLAPGPDSLLVLSRSLFGGWRVGWIASAGITTGNVMHAALAAAGISAVIAASPVLFDALRIAGALYLLWIGGRALQAAWRSWKQHHAPPLPETARPAGRGWRRIFVHAFFTNLLNPKIILFYLAFIPQFVNPAIGPVALQTFVYGITLTAMGLVYLLAVSVIAAGSARRFVQSPRFAAILDGVAGILFIGFALRLFLTERKLA